MSSPIERMSIPPPSGFLSLAPATSSSYPQSQATRRTSVATTGSSSSSSSSPPPTSRRSSGASSTGYKVLKLGPVHWGEHPEEHKEDFHAIH